MTIHLLRMAVGIDDVEHLRRFQKSRMQTSEDGRLHIFTRNTPRRAAELLDGGSVYLIIRGYVRVRQRILGIERRTDNEGRGFCAIELDPTHVPTVLQARRPQQGWRYLESSDAPIDRPVASAADDDMPAALMAELRDLGLL
ncbi:MAG: DUF1489 domain-containing protein [Alphaproteobacteria bacterium]|nr:DUF1489 domain-containing protein [Alphaproteobacteria bacterium]